MPPPLDRRWHFSLWYALVAVLLLFALQDYRAQSGNVQQIPYSQFQQELAAGKIADVEIGPDRLRGSYRKSGTDGRPQRFVTVKVDPDIARELGDAKVSFSAQPGPGWLQRTLGWLLPIMVFVGIWLWLARRMMGGSAGGGSLMAVGKSKARVFMEKRTGTTFEDVAGVDEAKEELQEIIAFLREPGTYGRLGARVPKGVLLVGPPGTGKTLLARAVAGEAGVPFFSISGSEFVEMFVGVGAARVRDLFEQARQHAPCIIFIDELDALGRARGAFLPGGGHDEKEQTLNQLLTELDGFDPGSGVVLLAATNRPEILDPALLRAGRFDRQVLVDRPDKGGREAILKVHLRKIHLADDVSVDELAALTTGLTGADLANLVNEGALLATRRNGEAVTMADLQSALERLVAGLEKKSRVLSPHERHVVACHEIGHALVAMALPGTDPVQKISIIPRGISALGYTIQRPTEDRFLMARGELLDRMAVLMGGRAAESLCFDEVSTGAADDLAKASEIARNMVARFGMAASLGQVSYESDPAPMLGPVPTTWKPRNYAETTAAMIDDAVRVLIEQAFTRARGLLQARRPLLDRAVAELLEHETLAGSDLADMARAMPTPVEPDVATR